MSYSDDEGEIEMIANVNVGNQKEKNEEGIQYYGIHLKIGKQLREKK